MGPEPVPQQIPTISQPTQHQIQNPLATGRQILIAANQETADSLRLQAPEAEIIVATGNPDDILVWKIEAVMGDGLSIRITDPEVTPIIRYGDFMKRVRRVREHNEIEKRKEAISARDVPPLPTDVSPA